LDLLQLLLPRALVWNDLMALLPNHLAERSRNVPGMSLESVHHNDGNLVNARASQLLPARQ
jgi:hypothetical protein